MPASFDGGASECWERENRDEDECSRGCLENLLKGAGGLMPCLLQKCFSHIFDVSYATDTDTPVFAHFL